MQQLNLLLAGDRRSLSRAITLCESTNPNKRNEGLNLLRAASLKKTSINPTIRVGISGPPGVGKSTFIEKFGCSLIDNHGKNIAVLPIDPSSPVSNGSILADRTRMEKLTKKSEAFIRPSPSGGFLGGVASRTKEAILLCEIAGYEIIIIETVGVGQSEIAIKNMCDIFIALQQPNAGDEIQAIKKGINEIADFIVITKNDGSTANAAQACRLQLESALSHYLESRERIPKIMMVSSILNIGIESVISEVLAHISFHQVSGSYELKRREQSTIWLKEEIGHLLWRRISETSQHSPKYQALIDQMSSTKLPASIVAMDMVDEITKSWPAAN